MRVLRKLILPAVLLLIGVFLYAVQGPLPLPTPRPAPAPTLNAQLDAVTANGGITMQFGNCRGTAGRATLLSTFSTDPTTDSGNYSAHYGSSSALACYVWVVNGNATNDTGSGSTSVTLTHPVVSHTDTVALFVVNAAGKWDQHSWGPGASNGTGNVVYSPTCASHHAAEALLFDPSGWTTTLSITYKDEAQPTCWVWIVDGQVYTGPRATPPNGGNNPPQPVATTMQFQYTITNTEKFVQLDIIDGDHGGDFDQYTWFPNACTYPPGQAQLTASANDKGEVSGTLTENANCAVGAGHVITEKLSDNTLKTATTNTTGHFKFGGTAKFPLTISFNGDSTVSSAAPLTCPAKNQACHT